MHMAKKESSRDQSHLFEHIKPQDWSIVLPKRGGAGDSRGIVSSTPAVASSFRNPQLLPSILDVSFIPNVSKTQSSPFVNTTAGKNREFGGKGDHAHTTWVPTDSQLDILKVRARQWYCLLLTAMKSYEEYAQHCTIQLDLLQREITSRNKEIAQLTAEVKHFKLQIALEQVLSCQEADLGKCSQLLTRSLPGYEKLASAIDSSRHWIQMTDVHKINEDVMLNELAKCEQVMKEILQLMAHWNGQNVISSRQYIVKLRDMLIFEEVAMKNLQKTIKEVVRKEVEALSAKFHSENSDL